MRVIQGIHIEEFEVSQIWLCDPFTCICLMGEGGSPASVRLQYM